MRIVRIEFQLPAILVQVEHVRIAVTVVIVCHAIYTTITLTHRSESSD